MGGPRRPAGDELAQRVLAYGEAWRAVASCTAPADRPRAEAAIRALYALDGRTEPHIVWAPSPQSGMLVFNLAASRHRPLVSRHARGDVGNGSNRDWNGMAEPLGMDPKWTLRLVENVRDRVWGEVQPGTADALEGAARRLGIAGTLRVPPAVRTLGLRPAPVGEPDRAAIARLAPATVLDAAWPALAGMLGEEMAADLVAESLARLAREIAGPSSGRRPAEQTMQPGQWEVLAPVMAAARDVLGGFIWRHHDGRAEHEAQVDLRLDLARSAGPWWGLDGLAIVCERPLRMRVDDQGRPHAADGPALAWGDGTELWAWHGVTVTPDVVLEPERITVDRVDGAGNAEVRRVLVERMGVDRLIREGHAELVDEDETGRLWRRPLRAMSWQRDEPVVTVEVRNSTPEPDGTYRTYFLRVPPTVRTAREAVAWTFGLGGWEYRPAVES